jgi:hypothetical protein
MAKLFLLSIVIATIALPAQAARQKNSRRGLRRALAYVAVFNAFYLFGLLFLMGRL